MLRLACRIRPFRSVTLSRPIRSVSSLSPPLIHIQSGTFYQNYPTAEDLAEEGTTKNPPLVRDFNFTLPSKPDENDGNTAQTWAVIGPPDKTHLLDVLGGKHICVPPNARSYPYLLTDEVAKNNPRARFVKNAIRYVGFSGEGSGAIGGTRGAYLSARYESLREETDWTVRQYLRGQTSLNPLAEDQDGTLHDETLLAQVITDLRLDGLLDMPVANLSNGQMRRTRIAHALLSKPELLLLDDAFMGLDPVAERSISDLLRRLAAKSEPRLIIALRPQDPIPKWISHVVVFGDRKGIFYQGRRDLLPRLVPGCEAFMYGKPFRVAEMVDIEAWQDKEVLDGLTRISGFKEPPLTRDFMRELLPTWKPNTWRTLPRDLDPPRGGEPLIEMDGVRVQYGDKVVLGDWSQPVNGNSEEGLHWTVRRGQRWAVLGANGSGKTTLLSLITSDHPQTYALPVRLFGRSRLPEAGKPGVSIFELQRRVGHSSPEIHAFFPRQLTIRQALESAFAETFLARPKLNYEADLDVDAFLQYFRPELNPSKTTPYKDRIEQISYEARSMLPYFRRFNYYKFYENPGGEVEYADSIKFGDLSVDLQRLVLFLRALVHRPDIVILDEAFSGMSSTLRDKCHAFLESGAGPESRFRGLSDQQALIMISHVAKEIPSLVRHYLRLPSGDKEGDVDFRFGTLKSNSSMSYPRVWKAAWAPSRDFEAKTTRADPTEAPEGEPVREDYEKYEWRSI
ncbi:putative ABC transporter [Aspergillus homomorphus CBS 101889]|uniref:ABC transporter n=1 Tax=Aspergillus homomorphus (strain CBS 101889) TaxID=1450537 RepID=A0A395HWW4_ASPHC|nr:ABC transporter [Aspergillus homomorphus CBS 101889]RAL11999.1 ABC transporter [Aspergillus homomorphus CBS 101889]